MMLEVADMNEIVIDVLIGVAGNFIQQTYMANALDCEFGFDPGFSPDVVAKLDACETFLDFAWPERWAPEDEIPS